MAKATTVDRPDHLPSWAHSIAALGPATETTVVRFFADRRSSDLFDSSDQEALKTLGASLARGWSDQEAAKVVEECVEAFKSGRKLDIPMISRWVLVHINDARSVLDCMSVDAPHEISIIQVLSRAGSQKLVFLATWRLTQTQVVLKKLTGNPELVNKIVARESQSHPLSMAHPNIISTHVLRNTKNESFLVEKRLPLVLSDTWDSKGIQEAANLLYNIADAVTFLHANDLVHGDIKPDNIGMEGDAYILLDFGICRHTKEFLGEVNATGSLRTRAPELLAQKQYLDPPKVDVWALAARGRNAISSEALA